MVIVMLMCATLIPRVEVGGYRTKRINILSDVVTLEEDTMSVSGSELVLDTTFIADVSDISSVDTIGDRVDTKLPYIDTVGTISRSLSDVGASPVTIEEYDGVRSRSSISAFYSKLKDSTNGDIRVAFFGDSFIEGDLFTADVRELLQSEFSGRGVGFVPITSIVSEFRGSIRHKFNGWTRHTLLKPGAIPEELKDKFYISGEVFEATEGAYVRYEGVNYRRHLRASSMARFIFMNRGNSTIHVVTNDTITQTFTPKTSDAVQEMNITGDIRSLEIKIENPDKFLGYGVVFEDGVGAVVDNYSLRGNSGLSLCGSSHLINRQINGSLKYDLIVLQYGLNVLSADVSDYSSYGRLMHRVVAHVRRSFPNSSILLMGVSDRSVQVDGTFITMPTLKNMLATQRSVAKSCGIAFWSTFDAMGGENSMVEFVNKKWGARDYTHFSQAGGKFLAKKFVASLFRGSDNFAVSAASDSTLVAMPDIETTTMEVHDPNASITIKRVVHEPITYNIDPLPVRVEIRDWHY